MHSIGSDWPVSSSIRSGFFGLGQFFFFALSWVEFWIKNHDPYLVRELLGVQEYGLYPQVYLVHDHSYITRDKTGFITKIYRKCDFHITICVLEYLSPTSLFLTKS